MIVGEWVWPHQRAQSIFGCYSVHGVVLLNGEHFFEDCKLRLLSFKYVANLWKFQTTYRHNCHNTSIDEWYLWTSSTHNDSESLFTCTYRRQKFGSCLDELLGCFVVNCLRCIIHHSIVAHQVEVILQRHHNIVKCSPVRGTFLASTCNAPLLLTPLTSRAHQAYQALMSVTGYTALNYSLYPGWKYMTVGMSCSLYMWL